MDELRLGPFGVLDQVVRYRLQRDRPLQETFDFCMDRLEAHFSAVLARTNGPRSDSLGGSIVASARLNKECVRPLRSLDEYIGDRVARHIATKDPLDLGADDLRGHLFARRR
jgi:hypothetical protein